ncbi:TetR family transcriptional regulator [Cellvibrio mixtus]|uniref:TetR family transcriptional regulator n=1 Tax=Cellvibrio mixtus TaxID=39650 RepID=A0A266Q309_9GAMM|nr:MULTISPECIES: TetR/AcrR family transcriptional regulator [Cellvibrio]AQT62523.1 TetR family transcriptional regulator [Cellvibrio sp. PSBB023]OZY83749.1 TetR family transcriptional regulator [Cellvibrio mixtus]
MKVSKAQVQENRARIVAMAAMLFRERGYDGVGVAELMAAAGLTHGGFYKHFKSKADLMAEAAAEGLAQSAANTAELDVVAFVNQYLSRQHRDAPGVGCTMAALCGDAARQPESIKAIFAAGIERQLAVLETHQNVDEDAKKHARAMMIETMAQAVGAIVLSRACPDDSPLADEILEICRARILGQYEQENEMKKSSE